MRDLVAGLYFVISPPGSGGPARPACPCGLVFDFVAKWIINGSVRSWMIPGGSWMSSGEY